MSSEFKVLTIVGTRPELIKLSRVIAQLDKYTNHILVHTGQNYDYELNEVFFKDLNIRKPDYFLDVATDRLSDTIANIISKSDLVFEQESPDAVLLLGDTNSCLSVISAKRRHIPIFHMEAGNRCFDQRVPEEINRKVVDVLSDINLPYTEHARRYLISEGLRPETTIKTGSPMREVIEYYLSGIESSDVLERLNLTSSEYFLVSVHREENVDTPENLRALMEILDGVRVEFAKKVLVSLHPRTKNRLEASGFDFSSSDISFVKPLGFFDYVKLQQSSFCVLSDSGTITEESAILNFPAVMLRQAHERPEGMDAGVLIMGGLNREIITKSIQVMTAKKRCQANTVADYEDANVSSKVVQIILSYTDYVNRTVWHK